jgi:hypothetical protein
MAGADGGGDVYACVSPCQALMWAMVLRRQTR